MACLRLGSKSEAFHREGQTWFCTSGLPSDITIEVGDMSFHLHKFPLLSRSGLLAKLIEDRNTEELESPFATSATCVVPLHDLPGGAKAFELVAKFCYGARSELSASNVIALRCAAEHLGMTDEVEEGNLVSVTDAFLDEVLATWHDALRALDACEDETILSAAEDLHIVSRCIDSLATKAEQNPNPNAEVLADGDGWWFEDVSFLSLPLFKRLIVAVGEKMAKPETVSAAIVHYARKYLPVMATDVNPAGPTIAEAEQRTLLEELVVLLPEKKGSTSSKTLLRLLRIAMMLHANPNCRENLEKRVGSQLDQALLVDLLVPNMGYSVETLYDVDCVQRIVDHFMAVDQDNHDGAIVSEEAGEGMTGVTIVAKLVDSYLAEVAVDVNLKWPKFQALAMAVPEYVRPVDDGIYNAIDVYLKAHPWVADSEREQICRLMNCQKLSLEASTHAAQNERLPLRVIVQVLFFEQLRLRTSISAWFFVSSDTANEVSSNNLLQITGKQTDTDMRLRVSEIEKECSLMRKELQKLVNAKKKSSWSLLPRRFGFRKRSSSGQESKSTVGKVNAVAPEALEGKVESRRVNGEVAAH